MVYEVEITNTAYQEIRKKLEKHLQKRLDKRIKKLRKAPRTFGKPLRGRLAGVWEIYFEKRYRLLYMIDETNKTIHIIGLKHKDEM